MQTHLSCNTVNDSVLIYIAREKARERKRPILVVHVRKRGVSGGWQMVMMLWILGIDEL